MRIAARPPFREGESRGRTATGSAPVLLLSAGRGRRICSPRWQPILTHRGPRASDGGPRPLRDLDRSGPAAERRRARATRSSRSSSSTPRDRATGWREHAQSARPHMNAKTTLSTERPRLHVRRVRTSALVTRVAVSVEDDHLEKLARPSRRLAGVAELIWNAVDAEADRVSVRVVDNPLQGVDVVEVIDNGHGMARAEALHDFKLLGGSWKRDQRRSKNGQRIVHGSEGEGRWRAFSLGDLVRWVSVTQNEAR